MTQEIVYTDRNNRIDLLLKDDSVTPGTLAVTDLTAVSRVVLKINQSTTLDSSLNPEYFDWATDGATGKLYLYLGAAGVREGHSLGSLVLYDPAHPEGLFWGEVQFEVRSNFGE